MIRYHFELLVQTQAKVLSLQSVDTNVFPLSKEIPLMNGLSRILTQYYPIWLVGIGGVAFFIPESFSWVKGGWITGSLALVMLGMGLTLSPRDFRNLLSMPGASLLGLACQFTLMPIVGWGLVSVFRLEPDLAIGIILLASCPGGTASNMIAYLAKANLALSVVLTMASTLFSFVMTPFWTGMLAGQYVSVDVVGIAWSTFQVVVAPVLIGIFCNWKFPSITKRTLNVGPAVAVVALCLITAGIVAQSSEMIVRYAAQLLAVVCLLHGMGFVLGFWVSRWLGFSRDVARTVSIEVGMQNGGMAMMLAKVHFAANPLAAVPMVFSAVMQNVIGSAVGGVWSRKAKEKERQQRIYAQKERANA